MSVRLNLHLKWNFILPAAALFISAILSFLGKAETDRVQAENSLRGVLGMWDYLAPSEVVLHSINYPAAVATALIRKPHTLEIGLEYSLWSYTIYLVFVASLWCVIGLFYELSRGTRKGGRWLSWSALICAISALLLAVVTFANWGGQALLLKIAGTLWCVALIVVPIWFLRKLRKQT